MDPMETLYTHNLQPSRPRPRHSGQKVGLDAGSCKWKKKNKPLTLTNMHMIYAYENCAVCVVFWWWFWLLAVFLAAVFTRLSNSRRLSAGTGLRMMPGSGTPARRVVSLRNAARSHGFWGVAKFAFFVLFDCLFWSYTHAYAQKYKTAIRTFFSLSFAPRWVRAIGGLFLCFSWRRD